MTVPCTRFILACSVFRLVQCVSQCTGDSLFLDVALGLYTKSSPSQSETNHASTGMLVRILLNKASLDPSLALYQLDSVRLSLASALSSLQSSMRSR